MEQKENVKPVEFEDLFGDISQDSLNLEASLAKKPPLTKPDVPPQTIDTQATSDGVSKTTSASNNNDADNPNQNENNDLNEQAPDTTLGDLSIGPALTTGPPSFESEDRVVFTELLKQDSNEPAGEIASEKKFSIDRDGNAQGCFPDQTSTVDCKKSSKTEQANSADGENLTVVHEAEKYADDLARKLLDDTNKLVRIEPRHSDAFSNDTTTTTIVTTTNTKLTLDDKKVESKADSLATEEMLEEDKESSKSNEERIKEENDKEQEQKEEEEEEVCMENKTVNEPQLSEPLKPSENEPEVAKDSSMEMEGVGKLDDGEDSECTQTNGNDKETNDRRSSSGSNNNNNKANEDQSATTAVEETVEEAVEVTQQQDLDEDSKKQQELVVEEVQKTVAIEKRGEEAVEKEKLEEQEEEEEEDIDDIVRRFERDTESEPSESEKEVLLESKEKKQEEFITQEDSKEDLKQETEKMEFAKNYSDDLLMGQNDQAELPSANTGADLADFELPPYSGSSSGSEPRQQSPVKRKSSSTNSSAQQQASSSSSSSSNQVTVAPPDLTALKNLLMSSYSKVSYIFHWKKPIETGLYFSIGATLIIALTFFSIISVVAYSALGLITASSLIRIYKAVMKTLGRSTDTPFDHVWDKVLSIDVSLSPEKIHQLLDASLGNLNSSFVYFKQVLLVEDKFATLKFGFFLYLLTYIGAWFNGMTLITITYLALFSVPIFYEKNKTKIDEYVNLATGQLTSVINMVTGKVSSTLFGESSTSSSGSKKQN